MIHFILGFVVGAIAMFALIKWSFTTTNKNKEK